MPVDVAAELYQAAVHGTRHRCPDGPRRRSSLTDDARHHDTCHNGASTRSSGIRNRSSSRSASIDSRRSTRPHFVETQLRSPVSCQDLRPESRHARTSRALPTSKCSARSNRANRAMTGGGAHSLCFGPKADGRVMLPGPDSRSPPGLRNGARIRTVHISCTSRRETTGHTMGYDVRRIIPQLEIRSNPPHRRRSRMPLAGILLSKRQSAPARCALAGLSLPIRVFGQARGASKHHFGRVLCQPGWRVEPVPARGGSAAPLRADTGSPPPSMRLHCTRCSTVPVVRVADTHPAELVAGEDTGPPRPAARRWRIPERRSRRVDRRAPRTRNGTARGEVVSRRQADVVRSRWPPGDRHASPADVPAGGQLGTASRAASTPHLCPCRLRERRPPLAPPSPPCSAVPPESASGGGAR